MLAQGRRAIYDWEHRIQADDQICNQRELREKKIWVDFERDAILINTLERGTLSQNLAPRPADPLELMRLHAEEELKKIRRLAVGGRWLCKGEATTSPGLGRP
jgi:hypothetical protein